MRRRTAASAFWGIALVAIGGLLLARNLGYPVPVWNAVALYWPLLIIGWGFLKLIDYFHLRKSGENRPLFSGGEVALLIIAIFAGSAITAAANIVPGFGSLFDLTDFDLWDITGNNFNYREHHEAAAPAGSSIEIFNMYGNVEIRQSDGDRIVLDVEKTVRASDRQEADERAPEFTFSIRNEGSRFRIASNQDVTAPEEAADRSVGQSREAVRQTGEQATAPAGQEPDLPIEAQIQQPVEERIQGRPGRISERLGRQRLRFKSNLVIQVPRNAMIQLNNRNGAVRVEDLTGDQTIDNKFGSVTVRRITGGVRIANAYGSVDVENVSGPLGIETSFQDVNVRNVRGSLDVKNRYGDVRLSFEQPPEADITVVAEFTDVELELPSDAAFGIVGETRFGDIDSEFGELQVSRSRGDRSLRGRNGQGGPEIRIETRNGDIRLERRG